MKHNRILSCGALGLALGFSLPAQAQNTVGGASTGSGIGSGDRNLIWSALYSRIGGGFTNVITTGANFTTIGGGYSNSVGTGTAFATVGGGRENRVLTNGNNSTIAGGFSNLAVGTSAFVGGGEMNRADGTFGTVGGGVSNTARGTCVVTGGSGNTASGISTAVGGGENNVASIGYATVAGGAQNLASGSGATVPGGTQNVATNAAFAAGINAQATNSGAFVWGSTPIVTASTNTNSFTVRAPGGARFISTGTTNLVGVILASNATAWAALSDSNAKTDIEPVNAREVLEKVAALPVTSWHYKHDLNRRYIGPMAQDFHAAFGLGADDKTITTLDTDGVTLAAIKGLVEELKERDQEIAGLKARNAQIEGQLREIHQRLDRLPPAP